MEKHGPDGDFGACLEAGLIHETVVDRNRAESAQSL